MTWRKPGISEQRAREIAVDKDGNIFVVGEIEESNTDAFLTKFNSSGHSKFNRTREGMYD
ncbi:MAG: hypothetical protein GF383_12205 [Candidatus Lokiarchaeota archaeon]|nr:hypothetical protein [Candidatus Lokiarchaeota archaeon]MBD3341755.1 hypothetical protein [Candidatus Lokiarchaeota archaeon]